MKMPIFFGAGLLGVILAMPVLVQGAEIPRSTQKILSKLKLPKDYLKGQESEYVMPAKWVAGAKKEGAAVMLSTWRPKQFKKFIAPFKERYPYAKMNYRRAGRFERSMKPVIAFKEGRFVGDILTSFNSSFGALKANKVLADLRELPNWKHLLPAMQGPGGWVIALWSAKGEKWTKNYLTKFFRETKPQRRNENRSASLRLALIGEYDIVIPAGGYKVKEFKRKGGAVGYHCPEIVPVSPGPMAMGRNNPHINTAKIFLNWFLTREG